MGKLWDPRTKKADPVIGNAMLLVPPKGKEVHPAANAPLDQEFVDQVRKLNLDSVRAELTGTVATLEGSDPIPKKAISTSNVEGALESLEFIKRTIEENPCATTVEFPKSYQAKMKARAEEIGFPG